MPDKIIRKTNMNRRTKQLTVTIPKRQIPKDFRFSKELFVELKILKERKVKLPVIKTPRRKPSKNIFVELSILKKK